MLIKGFVAESAICGLARVPGSLKRRRMQTRFRACALGEYETLLIQPRDLRVHILLP